MHPYNINNTNIIPTNQSSGEVNHDIDMDVTLGPNTGFYINNGEFGNENPNLYNRMVLQDNVGSNSSIPAISNISDVTPIDLPNFSALNTRLNQEERENFLDSVCNPDMVTINPVFSTIPYLTLTANESHNSVLAILFADLGNERLLSFIHNFIQIDHEPLQPVRGLPLIINLFVYFTANLTVGVNIQDFQETLRSAFSLIYQYNFFENVRVNHCTTLDSIQASLTRSNIIAGTIYSSSLDSIIENRNNTNINISELSAGAHRSQVINAVAFTMLNVLLANQMGLGPVMLLNRIRPLLSSTANPLNNQLIESTDTNIRLRDIYDLMLEKFHSFILN